MTNFRSCDVARELQIFRDAIFFVARRNEIFLDEKQTQIVTASIDIATCESLANYSCVHQDLTNLFIATLTHDLRNPLHIANASAQLIKIQSKIPSISALAERISFRLGDINSMIEVLLDAAVLHHRKKLKLHIVEFDMRVLVTEICNDLELCNFAIICPNENLPGHWCRSPMKRAIQNLISNAQKYGSKGSPITVTLERFDDRALVSVHNQGNPIPVGQIDRLFETFERLEQTDLAGWGLGLPLVQTVAESHGGSALVDSDIDRGTTFSLSLPLDSRPYAVQDDDFGER
jgi:signal transduction histidine kinase